MGMKLHYYIGPYLACGLKNNKKIPYKRKIESSCFNANCKKYHRHISSKFCPECGSEATNGYKEIFVDSIEMYEIQDQIKENLANFLSFGSQCECSYAKENKLHIWIANLNIDKVNAFYSLGDGDKYVPVINGELIEKHKKVFEESFKKEIAVIKKHYGDDQVKIEWGSFPYYI